MASNVIHFPSPCEECGRLSDGVFSSAPGKEHALCNVCGHGGGWCEVCDEHPAVTMRDMAEPGLAPEYYATCEICSIYGTG